MTLKNKIFWIYLLSAAVYFTQGIEGLPGLALFLYLKEHLGFSAEKIMYLGSIIGLAWLVKPCWGYLCDNVFTKKVWIFISLLGSILVSLFFGLSPVVSLPLIILMASIGSWNAAVRDVGVDGIMCVEGKIAQKCDKIQAVQWISIMIAGILVGLGGGYIAEHFNFKVGYLCLIPVYLIIVGIVAFYQEHKEKRTCYTCNFGSDCNSVESNPACWQSKEPKLTVLETIYSYKELYKNKQFLVACLFLFLYKYSPSFGTPLSFIERDVFHWSATWMGTLAAIVSAIEIGGAIVFFNVCKKINIKKWLYISVFLGAITSLCYLYYTPISAVAYGILFGSLGMFIHLIVMSFMAQTTIKGKEATSFALLCSISNLAGTASSLSGALLFPKIGLTGLIILSAATSFVCLPLISKIGLKNE